MCDMCDVCVCVSPDEINYMKSIVVDEMLQEMDKNKDGSVTVEEYIGMNGGGGLQGTRRVQGDLEGTGERIWSLQGPSMSCRIYQYYICIVPSQPISHPLMSKVSRANRIG